MSPAGESTPDSRRLAFVVLPLLPPLPPLCWALRRLLRRAAASICLIVLSGVRSSARSHYSGMSGARGDPYNSKVNCGGGAGCRAVYSGPATGVWGRRGGVSETHRTSKLSPERTGRALRRPRRSPGAQR